MIGPYLDRMRRSLERDMARVLAPELERANAGAAYIVFTSEAGLDGWKLNIRGLAGPWLSATYRDALADRWKGHGPCVLVNDSVANGSSSEMAGLACHEFGHHVRNPGWMVDYSATPPDTNKASDLHKLLTEPQFPIAKASPCPLGGHDLQWARVTLHLAARLEWLGWSVRRSDLGWPDWIADPFALWATVATEIDEHRGTPVSDVLATPTPEGLLNRWQELNLPTG